MAVRSHLQLDHRLSDRRWASSPVRRRRPCRYLVMMAPPVERTDAQIVRDVLAGDRDAFRLLVRRYGDTLHGHALRMTDSPDEAADLTQQALVRGFKKLGSCRDPERVGAWLFRIVANLCKDHVGKSRRRDVPLELVDTALTAKSNPEADAQDSEIRSRIWGALDALTPEQKEAFVLKHVEGRSYEEIAAVMDLSVASLKMRVHRAREALRGLLEEYA
jgi:RNA polymerase sigma-70 factor, ECF subfamily